MKRSLDISGVKLVFDKDLSETGEQVVKRIQERKEGLDKIKAQFEELKNKVGMYETQIKSLEIFLKGSNPDMYKNLEKLLNEVSKKETKK